MKTNLTDGRKAFISLPFLLTRISASALAIVGLSLMFAGKLHAAPDLIVLGGVNGAGALTVTPTPATVGSNVTIGISIKNQGSTLAGNSTTRLQIKTNSTPPGVAIVDVNIATPSIAAGITFTTNHPVQIPAGTPPGSYAAYVVLDRSNSVNQVVVSNDFGSSVAFTVQAAAIIRPVNDAFANRSSISAPNLTVAGTNTTATKESGEPNHAGNSGGKSVWWTWTPTTSGTATVSTAGSSFDTVLGVYTGNSVGGLSGIASNDDDAAHGLTTSLVTFNTTAGTVYQIAVDGYSGDSGSVQLAITPPPSTPLYKVNVSVIGSGSCSLQPASNAYAAGTLITVTTTPSSQYQFSEITGAQYSRDSVFTFTKGGADEDIQVKFVPILFPSLIDTTTANSTPATVGFGVPTTPTWVTVCERSGDGFLWNICTILRGNGSLIPTLFPNLGTVGLIRTMQIPEVTTPPFLGFPVHNGDSASTAPMTALMDHHRRENAMGPTVGAYDKDHAIRTFKGYSYPVKPADQGTGKDFGRWSDGVPTPSGINYVGVSSQGGSSCIQYDGHPGYDYGYVSNTVVYAASAGYVVTDADLEGSSLAGTGIASKYMKDYHALIVRHNNGYCTIYMHLSRIEPAYVDTSEPDNWKPIHATINTAGPIGNTGNFWRGNDSAGFHLHFEVWRLDGTYWRFADPYGLEGLNGSTTESITPSLWIP